MHSRSRALQVGVVCAVLGVGGGFVGGRFSQAQAPTEVKRNELLTLGIQPSGRQMITVSTVDIPPSGKLGRHFHYGDEFIYVVNGTALLEFDAMTKLTLKSGQSAHVQPERAHDARNVGTTNLRALVFHIRPHDKPPVVAVP